MLILPDTHRGTAPNVARAVLDNGTHHLIAEHFRSLERHSLFLLAVIDMKSGNSTYQKTVITGLTHRLYSIIVKQYFPTVRVEMVLHRVITVDARGSTNPYDSTAVGIKIRHPVVMQSSAWRIFVSHGEFLDFTCGTVIDTNTLAKKRENKMPLTIVGHGIDEAIAERSFFLCGTRHGIIDIEGTIGANPIVTRLIAVDQIGAFWGGRMSYHPSSLIHAIDTIVLYGTPDDAVFTSTDRGECTACSHMQISKFPTTEKWLLLWQHEQTAILTTHPEIILIILEQCPNIRRTQVECRTLVVIFPQFMLTPRHPTQSSTDCSHKQIVVTIGDGDTEKLFVATYLR